MDINDILFNIVGFVTYKDLTNLLLVNSVFKEFAIFWLDRRILERLNLYRHVPNLVQFFTNDTDLISWAKKDFDFVNSYATLIDGLTKYIKVFIPNEKLKSFLINDFHSVMLTTFYCRFKKREYLFYLFKLILTEEEYISCASVLRQDIQQKKTETIEQKDKQLDFILNLKNINESNVVQRLIKRCDKYNISQSHLKQRLAVISNFRSLKKHPIKHFIILPQQHLTFVQKKFQFMLDWMTEPYQWRWAKFLPLQEFQRRLMFIIKSNTSLLQESFSGYQFTRDQSAQYFLMFDSSITQAAYQQVSRESRSNYTIQTKRSLFLKALIKNK
jgi:hypothetical protein